MGTEGQEGCGRGRWVPVPWMCVCIHNFLKRLELLYLELY